MRRLSTYRGFAFTAALCIGSSLGCTTSGNSSSSPVSEILQRTARSILIGKAYDRAILAQQRGNEDAFEAQVNQLGKLGAIPEVQSVAEQAVMTAVRYDTLAEAQQGLKREALHTEAAKEYRRALRLSPHFNSDDPNILNALGYFLADRGTSPDDFRKAEDLTRRSIQEFNKLIAKQGDDKESRNAWLYMQASGPGDSLAWALYQQKRYSEAASEQEAVIQKVGQTMKAGVQGANMPADLPYHLGKIYQALKRNSDAQRQYEAALKIDSHHVPSREALQELSSEPLQSNTNTKP